MNMVTSSEQKASDVERTIAIPIDLGKERAPQAVLRDKARGMRRRGHECDSQHAGKTSEPTTIVSASARNETNEKRIHTCTTASTFLSPRLQGIDGLPQWTISRRQASTAGDPTSIRPRANMQQHTQSSKQVTQSKVWIPVLERKHLNHLRCPMPKSGNQLIQPRILFR